MHDQALTRFVAEVSLPEPELNLGRAALLLSLLEEPTLDIVGYLNRLDELADAARPAVDRAAPADRLGALLEFLCGDYGLSGNPKSYYDPRNSYLDQVLDRRLGIPISLAVVLIEVGRRIDLPLNGVGFPLHFLVGSPEAPHRFADPFNGRVLDEQECAGLLEELSRGRMRFDPASQLRPVGKRQILARMLRNLKAVYVRRRDVQHAVAVIDRLLAVCDDMSPELRDRGLLLYSAGEYERAANDLRLFLAYRPDGEESEPVRETLRDAERKLWLQN